MILKTLTLICFTTVATYAAIAPGQNAYLPPKKPGYNYDKPSVPFPSQPPALKPTPGPRPRPTPPSRPIPPTKPIYGPPRPFPPTPQRPSFPSPPAPQRPSFPSPPAPQRPSFPSPPAPQRPSFPSPPAPQRPSFPSPPAPQRPSYPPPSRPSAPGVIGQPTGPTGTQQQYPPGHELHVHMPGMPFDFNYAVKDDQFGNDYSHNAASDGDVTKGEYRIQLPDGRTQIVKYTADWKTGFHAQVKFEGTPNYQGRPSIPRPTQQFPSGPSPGFPTGPSRPSPGPGPSFPTGPSRPSPGPGYPSGPRPTPSFPSIPSRPSPSRPSPARPSPGPGYPSGPRPTPSFPSGPSRPNQIPGQQYDTNGGYKY